MTRVRTLCALIFTIALSAVFAGPASAASVAPQLLTDNVKCSDLNANPAFPGVTSNFGFKVNGKAPDGTYTLTAGPGKELTGGAPSDPLNFVTISNSDGKVFDWAASLGIDAVIVKGGDDSNVYVYTPESLGDTDLTSPLNNGGNVADISHVEFCYDYEVALDVVKTAETKLKRTWTWDIDKSGDQTTGGPLTPGDVFNVNYDVTVSATAADSEHVVEGTITVTNNTQVITTVSSVTDQLNDGTNATVDCPALPAVLDPGEDLDCTYEASGAGVDGDENNNTATVATSSGASGGADDAAVDWTTATVESIDECVDVEDDKGGTLGTVCAPADLANGSKTFQYTLDVANGGSCIDHTNTATFKTNDTDTTGSDSWTVATTSVNVTITKTIPDVVGAGQSQSFTFRVKDPSANEDAVRTITFGPGETNKSVTVTGLQPDVYTVSEDATSGWNAQADKNVDVSDATTKCTGTVAFANTQTPADPPIVPQTPQAQNDPQPQQQQPPPAQQQVLGERVSPGTARFGAATGCQGKVFTVRVKGRSISRVEFSVDGKRLATDRTPDSQGRYTFRVNPNKFKPGAHRITARAVFTSASGTRPKTMSGRFSRCVRAAQAPAFTG